MTAWLAAWLSLFALVLYLGSVAVHAIRILMLKVLEQHAVLEAKRYTIANLEQDLQDAEEIKSLWWV